MKSRTKMSPLDLVCSRIIMCMYRLMSCILYSTIELEIRAACLRVSQFYSILAQSFLLQVQFAYFKFQKGLSSLREKKVVKYKSSWLTHDIIMIFFFSVGIRARASTYSMLRGLLYMHGLGNDFSDISCFINH